MARSRICSREKALRSTVLALVRLLPSGVGNHKGNLILSSCIALSTGAPLLHDETLRAAKDSMCRDSGCCTNAIVFLRRFVGVSSKLARKAAAVANTLSMKQAPAAQANVQREEQLRQGTAAAKMQKQTPNQKMAWPSRVRVKPKHYSDSVWTGFGEHGTNLDQRRTSSGGSYQCTPATAARRASATSAPAASSSRSGSGESEDIGKVGDEGSCGMGPDCSGEQPSKRRRKGDDPSALSFVRFFSVSQKLRLRCILFCFGAHHGGCYLHLLLSSLLQKCVYSRLTPRFLMPSPCHRWAANSGGIGGHQECM